MKCRRSNSQSDFADGYLLVKRETFNLKDVSSHACSQANKPHLQSGAVLLVQHLIHSRMFFRLRLAIPRPMTIFSTGKALVVICSIIVAGRSFRIGIVWRRAIIGNGKPIKSQYFVIHFDCCLRDGFL